jgi:hypothetical protein
MKADKKMQCPLFALEFPSFNGLGKFEERVDFG